jgi:hypothetical protein
MNEYLAKNSQYDVDHSIKSEWWKLLQEKVAKNKEVIQVNY